MEGPPKTAYLQPLRTAFLLQVRTKRLPWSSRGPLVESNDEFRSLSRAIGGVAFGAAGLCVRSFAHRGHPVGRMKLIMLSDILWELVHLLDDNWNSSKMMEFMNILRALIGRMREKLDAISTNTRIILL